MHSYKYTSCARNNTIQLCSAAVVPSRSHGARAPVTSAGPVRFLPTTVARIEPVYRGRRALIIFFYYYYLYRLSHSLLYTLSSVLSTHTPRRPYSLWWPSPSRPPPTLPGHSGIGSTWEGLIIPSTDPRRRGVAQMVLCVLVVVRK